MTGAGTHDVVVVGAGPAGTATARGLAAAGHDVLVVEEHPHVGEPVQCAGLLTPRLLELVPTDLSDLCLTSFKRARIFSPDGTPLELASSEVQQIASDRAAFDQRLAVLAREAGARIGTGAKVVGLERDDAGVRLLVRSDAGDETLRARLVVGADGAQSRVAKWAGLFQQRQFISLHGAQMRGLEGLDEGCVEMWTGRGRAPGFFSYIVPTGPDTGKVEVGVWNAPRPARTYFEAMFTDPLSAPHLARAEPVFTISATIPFGPSKRSVADRVALVGDAAGQAKPTTGGGIYPALVCANHLVEAAHAALEDDDLSAKRLSAYHEAWSATIGRELAIGLRLRHAFLQLSDDQLDDLWTRLSKPEVTAILNAAGDIDYPSKVALALLREEPGLFRFAPPLLKGFLVGAPE